ncbi:MAG: hypothetical protein JOZ55_11000, partial [Alphaproteobacteria bacterium]|nr:hypothetical protein [Alphaproteobacteria bacterium]
AILGAAGSDLGALEATARRLGTLFREVAVLAEVPYTPGNVIPGKQPPGG